MRAQLLSKLAVFFAVLLTFAVAVQGARAQTKRGTVLWQRVPGYPMPFSPPGSGLVLFPSTNATTAVDVRTGKTLWTAPVPLKQTTQCNDFFTHVYPNNTLAVYDTKGAVVLSFTSYDVRLESCAPSAISVLFSQSSFVLTVPRPVTALGREPTWHGSAFGIPRGGPGAGWSVSVSPMDGSMIVISTAFTGGNTRASTVRKYDAAGALVFTTKPMFPLGEGSFTPDGAFYYVSAPKTQFRTLRGVAVINMTSGAVWILPAQSHVAAIVPDNSPNLLFLPEVDASSKQASIIVFDLRAQSIVARRTVSLPFPYMSEIYLAPLIVSDDKVVAVVSNAGTYETVLAAVGVSAPHALTSTTTEGSFTRYSAAGAGQIASLSMFGKKITVYNTTTLAPVFTVTLPVTSDSQSETISYGGDGVVIAVDRSMIFGVAVGSTSSEYNL